MFEMKKKNGSKKKKSDTGIFSQKVRKTTIQQFKKK